MGSGQKGSGYMRDEVGEGCMGKKREMHVRYGKLCMADKRDVLRQREGGFMADKRDVLRPVA